MKKTILIFIILCLTVSFFSCRKDAVEEKPDVKEEYNSVYSLIGSEDVVSVKLKYGKDEKEFSAYTLVYKAGGEEKTVDITVPHDYKSVSYPTVMFFPNGATTHNADGETFAKNGIISFTFISNVTDYDLGEKDMQEVSVLFSLLEKCTFIDNERIYTVGSNIGSVKSFLVAKEYGERIAGVVVSDAICDLAVYYGWGQGSDITCEGICKGSPTDVPAEYEKRSAVCFSDKILCPVLFITYEQDSPNLVEQCEKLKNSLVANGIECKQILINGFNNGIRTEEAEKALCDFIK